jgi:YHS domain-containing protein
MIGWVLRAILFLIVLRLVFRFIASVMEGMSPASSQQKAGKKKSVPLVKDPVCGTYVVRERALTLDAGKQTQYFCSERCRDQYVQRAAPAIAPRSGARR